jgi:hypothetical protein
VAERAEIVLSAVDRTRAAFQSAQGNLARFQTTVAGSVGKIGGALAGIGVGVSATALAIDKLDPRPVIEYADSLDELSQRSGIAVESLSVLGYQAKIEGISMDDLASSLKRLNVNIAEAAKGNNEQAAAFRAIGVSVVDATGKVRSADEVLADIADRFATYEAGPKKVALANALAGKSFESLIPLLNNGREGFQQARAELEKFGGVLGPELAADAATFNDNMTKLGVASDALKVAIASGVVPALAEQTTQQLEAIKTQGVLGAAVENFLRLLSGQAQREFVFGKALPPDKLQEAQREVDALTVRVKLLQDQLARAPNSSAIAGEIKRLQQAQQQAQAVVDYTAEAQREVASLARRPTGVQAVAKRQAPDVPGAKVGGASPVNTAELLRRKELDSQIKKIELTLEEERDLFQNHNRRLADAFSDGQLSIEQYFSRRTETQAQYLERVRAGYDAEIKLLQDAQAKIAGNKPQDRADAQARIDEVYAKQARAVREAAQATEEAERDRMRATNDYRAALRDLDAQIADLSGNTYAADLLRDADTLAQARALLARGGGDPAREEQLANLLRLQTEVNKSRQDYSLIIERAQAAEERFLIQAERGGLSRIEVEQGVASARQASLRELDELIARTEALAATTKDPSVLAYFENLKLARERAFDASNPGLQRFNELAREAGSSIASSLADAARNGGKLRDVLSSIGGKLLDISTRVLIEQPLEDVFTKLLKQAGQSVQAGGGAGGGGFFDGVFKAFGLGGAAAPAGAAAQVPQVTDEATAALAGLAGESQGVTGVLAALPGAATVPMVAAFSALTVAATSAAAALQAVAVTGGASSGLSLGSFGLSSFGTGAPLDFGFDDFGLFLHGGGVAGVSGGTQRRVAPTAWASAERYHRGGVAGLAPDEVPAILRRGEEVLTQVDPRHRSRMGDGYGQQRQQPINQTINLPPNSTRETATQVADRLYQRASFASRKNR